MSIIIGIDPGSRMTGYGIIRQTGDRLIYLDAGTIHTEAADMPERLKRIFAGISRIVAHYQKYLPLENQHTLLENTSLAPPKIFPHPSSMVKPQTNLTVENPLLTTENPSKEPIIAAIEQVFMASNPDSALKLGQARGAAIAALVAKDLPVHEYTARQIKQAVCGYGAADKEQVQEMVVRLLNLPIMPQADAADGLACAICHAHSNHSMQKLLTGAGLRGSSTAKKKGRWRLSEADLVSK